MSNERKMRVAIWLVIANMVVWGFIWQIDRNRGIVIYDQHGRVVR